MEGGVARMDVLVVDDSPAIIRVLSKLLKYRGVEFETAGSGKEALAAFERRRFRVVISDLDMPEMNGVELATTLRERYPDVNLLAFTGSSGADLLQAAYRAFSRIFDKSEPSRVVEEAVRLLQIDLNPVGAGHSGRPGSRDGASFIPVI